MPTDTLTPIVDRHFRDLARQIRGQRLQRALCRLVLILAGVFAGLFLLDFLVPFSSVAVRFAFTALVGVFVLGGLFGLISGLQQFDSAGLAALIEQKHPELGERLISMTALSEGQNSLNWNPEFLALLRQETESRLAQVDVRRSFSSSLNRKSSVLAGMALVLVILTAFFWNAYADFAERLLNAWGTPVSVHEDVALHPVKLTEQPSIRITPPGYVNRNVQPARELVGAADLSVLQYSTVLFQFRFDRPALAASVELTTASKVIGNKSVQLSGDGLAGSFSVPALKPGIYRMTLLLEGKDKAISRQELSALEIWSDDPPQFTEVLIKNVPGDSLVDQVWSMPPEDAIPVTVTIEDKVGMDKVALEYRINDGPTKMATIAAGMGHTTVTKEILFRPAEKLKDGDTVRFRILAGDNRSLGAKKFEDATGRLVPEKDLGPQMVHYPVDRWFRVKIDSGAKPLPEQDILAQRERIHNKVQDVIKKLKDERADLNKVRDELDNVSPHQSADWDSKVDKLRKTNQAISQDLHWLALDLDGDDILHPLATLAWDVAETELKDSAQALDKAKVKTLATERRDQHLQTADAALAKAQKRLEKLIDNNQQLAENRLDQFKLEKLAGDQENLGAMAEKDLTPEELAQLRAGEERLSDELQSLAKTSKLLQETLEAARQEDMRRLDALARTPEGQELQKEFAPQLDVLRKKQKDLASKMAGGTPKKEAEDAARALELGQMEKALQFQQSAMKKLAHLVNGKPAPEKTSIAKLAKEQKELNQSLKKIASAMADKIELKLSRNKMSDPHAQSNQEKAGQAMNQAKKQIEDALLKLKLGKSQEARPAMQQAARELKQAANQTKQHMTRSQQAGVPGTAQKNPGKSPPSLGSKARSGPLRPDLKKYSAEGWGRMPGQLRTRILQDLRARYGEDYAWIIQGYFEKLGEEPPR